MSFVANDYVGMAYDWFYEDTAVGAWLNETAHSPFKTDGVVTGIAEGIGEMIGVIGLAMVTGGGSAIAMAGVAGVSAAGRAVESNWNEARENAEEGEDWRTLSTWASGMTEGVLTGAWEGVSWYIGSEIFMTKFGTRVGRMAWDTATGALDVPARTLITFISTGGETSLAEAFAEQGGWQGVLTCASVALIGSGVGEYFDYRSSKNTQISFDEKECVNDFIQNPENYGKSFETYLKEKYGIDTMVFNSNEDLATGMGDSKLYLWSQFIELYKSNKASGTNLTELDALYKEFSKSIGDLDSQDMFEKLSPYLSKTQKKTYKNITKTGYADKIASSLTTEQLDATYNYTRMRRI